MNRRVVFALLSFFALTVTMSPALDGYPGGVASSNLEYDCGGSCHTSLSSATITMYSPSLTVVPGEYVNITVNVTGGQQTIGNPLGVMLVRAFTTSSSLPSVDGWTIVRDPGNVTIYNYYENASYDGSCSLVWGLTAPSTPGFYILYARTMHGGGDAYSVDDVIGLTFEVTIIEPVPEFSGVFMPIMVGLVAFSILWMRRRD